MTEQDNPNNVASPGRKEVVTLDEYRSNNDARPVGEVADSNTRVIAVVGEAVEEAALSLCLYGTDLEPRAVTETLGVEPTRSARRGERMGERSPPLPHGLWIWSVRSGKSTSAEEAFVLLVDQFSQSAEVWTELRRTHTIRVRCAIHFDGWNRVFSFPPLVVEWLNRVGAGVMFDLYSYGDEDDD